MPEHIRLWDKDFNLLYQYEGDVADLFNDMHVTVDTDPHRPNWRTRHSARITATTLNWHKTPYRPDTDPT